MSKEIAVREQKPFELTEKQLNIIANTEFVPKDKRGKMDVILASVFRGRALGIDDMTAIQQIAIVNGRPAESASLAAGLVRRRGHFIDGKVSPSGAVAHGKRADNGAELTVEFGPEEAKAAGLEGNVNYKKFPQSMYWARAVTQLCRSLFSDCFLGGTYTPDELGADYIPDEDVIDVKGEEVYEPIPDEADIGLAEPEPKRAPDGAIEGGDDTAGSGSVSPLDLLIGAYGRDVVATAYREEFPGRGKGPLSEGEIDRLADRLNTAAVNA